MSRNFFDYFDRKDKTDELLRIQAAADKVSYAFINMYIGDGFRRICDVDNAVSNKYNWTYTNIDAGLMYMNHRSWVYFITRNLEIVKIGETEQPLGIETHPGSGVLVKTTESRLGRYRRHDKGGSGDDGVREGLQLAIVNDDIISFWAKPCVVKFEEEILGGTKIIIPHTAHKFLEKYYQALYIDKVKRLPELNKIKK